MQYVRSLSTTVSSTWNSINPATLSGAIDVLVIEQEDGSLACSPFHIRFGKFSLLRPYEKKVIWRVNGVEVVGGDGGVRMKLGEGGEAFFVFETRGEVPEGLQTSPLVSPATSPELPARDKVGGEGRGTASLQEPEHFALEDEDAGAGDGRVESKTGAAWRQHRKSTTEAMMVPGGERKLQSGISGLSPLSHSSSDPEKQPVSGDHSDLKPLRIPKLERTATDSALPAAKAAISSSLGSPESVPFSSLHRLSSPLWNLTDGTHSTSPPPSTGEARTRAMNLSKKLWTSNISNQVTESGDLVLDMTGFKSSDGEALHAELIARQLLSEEIDGPYDIGALIGADKKGNLWIYSSEEAKEAAGRKPADSAGVGLYTSSDAISDPGYHSDDARSDSNISLTTSSRHIRRDSDSALGTASQASSPGATSSASHSVATVPVKAAGDPNKNYAKTLRLTSDQLKTMNLKPGANSMSFTVNRATCHATLWYWHHSVPIVISDIDGTITKSDVLGHVLNSIGRDWTHQGVAKLYSDIAANGYNFLYLTSRSVGQADTTKAYLEGVVQEGYRLPKGPVILSPDRTIAALRREIYLRKPEIFKMACLRDIMALFSGHGGAQDRLNESVMAGLSHQMPNVTGPMGQQPGGSGSGRGKGGSPFYAGFGNRLTDALSYRAVNIPSTRIFTINSNSEVSLDLLSLNKYKTAYGGMREIVDHYFPPIGLLVKGGGEDFTDFNYWRDKPMDLVDFTDSDSEEDTPLSSALQRTETVQTRESVLSEDEAADELLESYMSDPRLTLDESIPQGLGDDEVTSSMLYEEDDEAADEGDDELELEGDDEEEEEGAVEGLPITPDTSESGRRLAEDVQSTPRGPGGRRKGNEDVD